MEAHEDLKPGSISLGVGELTNASVNRSRVAFDRNPDKAAFPAAIDPQMTVLKFRQSGNEVGAIRWFATHNTSITNANTLISPDNKGCAAYQWEHDDKGVRYLDNNAGTTCSGVVGASTIAGSVEDGPAIPGFSVAAGLPVPQGLPGADGSGRRDAGHRSAADRPHWTVAPRGDAGRGHDHRGSAHPQGGRVGARRAAAERADPGLFQRLQPVRHHAGGVRLAAVRGWLHAVRAQHHARVPAGVRQDRGVDEVRLSGTRRS